MNFRRYLSIVGGVLIAVGFTGFMGAALLCCVLGPRVPASLELPMGEMRSIAVDRAGTIYCASSAYGRIQVFDRDGRFLRGFFAGGGGGNLTIAVDGEGRLEVHDSKGRTDSLYTPDGTLVTRTASTGTGPATRNSVTDGTGTTYSVLSPSIQPRVLRTRADGSARVIVSVPWYLLLFQGPLPAWLIAMSGMALAGLAEARKTTRKQ